MRTIAAIILACFCAVSAAAWPWSKPKVHQYKIISGDGGQSVLEGEKIRVKGLCVELILHGRVDTIMCGIKYITELPDEEARPAVEEPVKPEPPAVEL